MKGRSNEWKKKHSRKATAQRAERATTLVSRAYWGSDGQVTMQAFSALLACGYNGELACLLFRAMKASTRAKMYRGGRDGEKYKDMAYQRKGESLRLLCEFLDGCDPECWGWKRDHNADHRASWVIYVETPSGQISFHSETRYAGPNFRGQWDRGNSENNVVAFCESVLADAARPAIVVVDEQPEVAQNLVLDRFDWRQV